MSRWDDDNFDRFHYDGPIDDSEESRLLRKFHDYKELEKKEIERSRFLEVSNKKKPGIWTNRFILSAIIQVAIITSLTISLVVIEMVYSEINLMQLLAMSFGGPAKWFFFGYIMYMTLVVAIAITAVFYNHLEVNLKKKLQGYKNLLAWMQLIGMNVGGTIATALMIWVGLSGAGISTFVASEGSLIESNPGIMENFVVPIGFFVAVLAVGTLAGGVGFLSTYLKKSDIAEQKNFSAIQFETEKSEFDSF